MCRPTGTVCSVQKERSEMQSIESQLRKLIGFNPVVVTSRRPRESKTFTDSKVVAATPPAKDVSSNEFILWEHKLVENRAATQEEESHLDVEDWKNQTSEVAHFFRSQAPHSCDTTHVPSPARTFTQPIPKDQQRPKGLGRLQHPTEAKRGYSLFKQGILPEWEDPKNANGGSWFIRQYIEPSMLDSYWKNLITGLVDQKTTSLEGPRKNVWRPRHRRTETSSTDKVIFDHINGIRIDDKTNQYSQRAMYKIEIWLDTTDSKICEQVREWMLSTMLDGRRPMKPLRTHFKSFAEKIGNDEKSQVTSSTVSSSEASSSSS